MQLFPNIYLKRHANVPSFPIPPFKSIAATQEKRIFDIFFLLVVSELCFPRFVQTGSPHQTHVGRGSYEFSVC